MQSSLTVKYTILKSNRNGEILQKQTKFSRIDVNEILLMGYLFTRILKFNDSVEIS